MLMINILRKIKILMHETVAVIRFWTKKRGFKLGKRESYLDRTIIVSLTSHPKRFDKIVFAIVSIFNQTLTPDRIILYLDEDVDLKALPTKLTKLQKYGLEILKRPENIKPHKKYYYSILENPEAYVITVDDDILYDKHLIQKLFEEYEKHSDCVIAARGHRINYSDDGRPLKYLEWDWESKIEHTPDKRMLATGVGGVLYPPHMLPEQTFNLEDIKKCCLNADDIWLKAMENLAGVNVCLCDKRCWERSIYLYIDDIGLNMINNGEERNNTYIKGLIERFGMIF